MSVDGNSPFCRVSALLGRNSEFLYRYHESVLWRMGLSALPEGICESQRIWIGSGSGLGNRMFHKSNRCYFHGGGIFDCYDGHAVETVAYAVIASGSRVLVDSRGGTVLWDQSPCAELEEERTAPLEFWLALGSANNGSYRENQEFASACEAASGKEAKREIARDYIQENRKELFSLPRLISKTRCNFASGFFGLPDFQRSPGSFAYELFNDYGKYGGYVAMLATGYFYALLIFGILSGILGFRNLIRGGSPEWMIPMIQLTIFGLMLFLMIWEANNRQLYNHMPWLALMGVFGISETFG